VHRKWRGIHGDDVATDGQTEVPAPAETALGERGGDCAARDHDAWRRAEAGRLRAEVAQAALARRLAEAEAEVALGKVY
jgi:hypothetical protein